MMQSTRSVSRRSLTTLSLVLLGALWAPSVVAQSQVMPSGAQYQNYSDPCQLGVTSQSACAQIILKPTVEVRNVHPSVSSGLLWCATKLSEPNNWASTRINLQVQNRDVSYTSAANPLNLTRINILKTALVPNQSLSVICDLLLTRANANGTSETRVAVASASTPLVPNDTNWHVVATGSTVTWTQTVTIPNATP
jgi:hypothetical protein